MNDTLGMGGVETVGNFDAEVEKDFHIEWAAHDDVLQGPAVEVFHGDECLAVLLTNVVNGADVGVVQRGSCLGFTLKPRQDLRIAGDVRREEFECDKATQASVFGFVDDAHASAAETFDDAVVRKSLVN